MKTAMLNSNQNTKHKKKKRLNNNDNNNNRSITSNFLLIDNVIYDLKIISRYKKSKYKILTKPTR